MSVSVTISIDEWAHMVMSFDDAEDTGKVVYKNGVLDCFISVTCHLTDTSDRLTVGKGVFANDGWANEARIYSRMLRDSERGVFCSVAFR